MKNMHILRNEYVVSIILFVLFTIISIAIRPSSLDTGEVNFDFGAEYGNIAASVAKGDGFANVFTDDSGPTAWHPPLTVYLMASVFFIFGVKSYASMWVLFLLRNIAFAFTAFFLLKISDKTGYGRYRLLSVLFFVLLIILNKNTLLYRVDDVFLITFLSSVMVYSVVLLIQQPSRKVYITLYILAFVLPLTVPSMALGFVVLMFGYFVILAFQLFKSRTTQGSIFQTFLQNPSLRAIVFSGLIFIMGVSMWSYRNYVVFDKFIPIKSNLWVEFYFANVLDEDGILSKEFFRVHHPSNFGYALDMYLEQGEVQFIEERKALAQQYVDENLGEYYKKVGVRAFNAFVHTSHLPDTRPADLELFSAEELFKLEEAQLLTFEHWTSLNLNKKAFVQQIQPLNLKNEQAAIDNWAKQKKSYLNRKYRIDHLVIGGVVALVPFVCFLIGLFVRNIRRNTVFIVTSVIYFIHLVPYILVSHAYRYQFALVALQAILMFFVACAIITAIRPFVEKSKESRILQES